jgi:hypothetical protein
VLSRDGFMRSAAKWFTGVVAVLLLEPQEDGKKETS